MAKSYEELMGAVGRGIFFRPERKKVHELLARDVEPRVRVGRDSYPVVDISLNGLSVQTTSDIPAWTEEREVELELLLDGETYYKGPARVARMERGARGTRVGLGLVSGFLDLPDISWQYEERRLREDLNGAALATHTLPRRFLDATQEAVHFLQHYRHVLERTEARYQTSNRDHRRQLIKELGEQAAAALRPKWESIVANASAAAEECFAEPAQLRLAKRYTETVVTPLVLGAPMPKRAYQKPLGYPGDYRVMLYYYANELEGDTVYDQVIHKYFVDHPLSAGVRTRSAFVVDIMKEEIGKAEAASMAGDEFRVASLGCGPAREVPAFTAIDQPRRAKVSWTLIDQEDEALSIAFQDGRKAISTANTGDRLQCLNMSFVQILADPHLMPLSDKQHLIFSTGLFDYLSERRSQSLIAGLYDLLAPGGLLAIANAARPNQYFWSPEFVLDWTLLYRTEREMLRLGDTLPPEAERKVAIESGKAYYFLLVRKPVQSR